MIGDRPYAQGPLNVIDITIDDDAYYRELPFQHSLPPAKECSCGSNTVATLKVFSVGTKVPTIPTHSKRLCRYCLAQLTETLKLLGVKDHEVTTLRISADYLPSDPESVESDIYKHVISAERELT